MLAKRDGTPVVDLAVLVASPALVMLMVGSLVWFLVEVLAPGPHPGRLLWCLSFFVFGAVLIARLTIEHGSSYAAIYAVALGGVTLLAMIRFVEYPTAVAEALGWLLSLALMGLVWWLANRLTWDCTHLDEDQKTSGRGLLLAAGLDAAAEPEPTADEDADGPAPAGKRRKKAKDSPGLMGWLERYWHHRDARRKRPHTPGTWVLWVGLAALPVFALGQSLVPADDADRRRATLLDAMAFVASGLGLLVVTSLMGLRRYLEQRDARVPLPMTAGWLGLGAGLIAAFVVAAAVLPRPASETAWFGVIEAGAGGERAASRNAVVRDNDGGKGEGADGGKPDADGHDDGQDGKGPEAAEGGHKDGGKGGDGKQGSGGNKPDKSGSGGQSGKSSAGGRQSSGAMLAKALDAAGSVVKWVVWVAVALLAAAAAVFFVLKGLSPFTAWAARLLDWLRNLFARKDVAGDGTGPDAAEDLGPGRVPFAAFNNPFTDGSARRRPAADLALYTLAAFDAWAGDHGAGRLPGETPAEFAARVGADFPDLAAAGRRAADLAVRALYSNAPLPADAAKALAALWQKMDATAPVAS